LTSAHQNDPKHTNILNFSKKKKKDFKFFGNAAAFPNEPLLAKLENVNGDYDNDMSRDVHVSVPLSGRSML
jgi:hypothetical protein